MISKLKKGGRQSVKKSTGNKEVKVNIRLGVGGKEGRSEGGKEE